MGKNRRSNQRSQLQKGRGEYYASFGFRHSLSNGNPELYSFIDELKSKFSLTDEKRNTEDAKARSVSLTDPSKVSLKVVERYSVTKTSRKERCKLTRSDLGAIKQDVRREVSLLDGVDKNGLTVVFDRLVTVGSERQGRDQAKFALAPRIDQQTTGTLLAEHDICMSAMYKWGMPKIRFPSSEWIPHITVVTGRENTIEVGVQTEETLKEVGGFAIN